MPHTHSINESGFDKLVSISLLLQQMNRDIERKFHLSLVQFCVLMQLRDIPATSSSYLAEAVGVTPGTLTQTLRRLVKKKYVFATTDPKDQRRKLISLTRHGLTSLHATQNNLRRFMGNNAYSPALKNAVKSLRQIREDLKRCPPSATQE